MRISTMLTPLTLFLLLSFFSCKNEKDGEGSKTVPQIPSRMTNEEVNARVKAIMSKMELIDKVGEMTQLSIDMLSVGEPYQLKEPHELDEEKLRKVLVDFRVGSILNIGKHAFTRAEWHNIIGRIQAIATKEKPTGIPVLYGIDAIHGMNYTTDGTLFPQQINLAATWNPDYAKTTGAITAYECRASAIPWNFSPVLDIGREVRWPRFWETFGEDPVLATAMGTAMIEGYQGDDINDPNKVAACMKHFIGYSGPRSGKDRTQALIPERQLREYYLPTFKAAVDMGAATIMINSGEMNGIPVHANPKILIDLLRNELGFTGLAVSDWEDIRYLFERHRIAKDYKEAVKIAINAGIDMSMVPVDLEFPVLLKELVEEGEVPLSRIDEAVERIIRLKVQLGLFENPTTPKDGYPKFASPEHTQASLEAATASIVLLKNENATLPLNPNTKLLVTGPTANSILAINGGWSRTWQGTDLQYHSSEKKTILAALEDKLGKDKVKYVEGTSIEEAINIRKAATVAKTTDAVVVCLGEMPYTEKVGDIDFLLLPQAQRDLVKAVAKAGKPVILVMVGGRPRLFNEVEPLCDAIFNAMLPGDEGGVAFANLLLGEANPSGKLPFTYPKFDNTLVPYDHRGTDLVKKDFSMNAFDPQYEFGHGLSYTSFEYSNLGMPQQFDFENPVEISVEVKNTGAVAGSEVVQLYIADKVASITPSVKRLRGFDKINLRTGESKKVTFSITAKDLAFIGLDNEWITEPGEFEVSIGNQKGTMVLGVPE
ncbi:MAG: glycoside hydrolase family 3 N-terminal domain-containing protein [Bacteroidota bacterium]